MDEPLKFSIVVPCYNEAGAIEQTVRELSEINAPGEAFEVIFVDDGSCDRTRAILEAATQHEENMAVVVHERNRGYGASLKTGIRRARADLVVITDADGTYPNERIPELVEACRGHDMVVGARVGKDVTYSKLRMLPKYVLRAWMSWLSGRSIPDINSGMRVFRKCVVEQFIGILPDGFSFTVTITLAMLTTYRSVLYVPIPYNERIGTSKIKPVKDTLRFIALIMRTGTYFAPLRAFSPIVLGLAVLAAASLVYDLLAIKDLTDKTVLLFLFALNTGMFALLADMIDKRGSK